MFVLSSFKHTSIILYPTFTFHILGRCRSLPPCFISCFGLRHIPFVVVCLNLYLIPYVCMYFNCRSRFDGDAFYVNSMSILCAYDFSIEIDRGCQYLLFCERSIFTDASHFLHSINHLTVWSLLVSLLVLSAILLSHSDSGFSVSFVH